MTFNLHAPSSLSQNKPESLVISEDPRGWRITVTSEGIFIAVWWMDTLRFHTAESLKELHEKIGKGAK